MLTQKWHAFVNLCESATHVGEIQSLPAGVYEASYKQCKSMYAHSVRRKRSAMDGVVAMESNDSAKAYTMGFNLNRLWGRRDTSAKTLYMMDPAVRARLAAKCTMSTIASVMIEVERNKKRPLEAGEGVTAT